VNRVTTNHPENIRTEGAETAKPWIRRTGDTTLEDTFTIAKTSAEFQISTYSKEEKPSITRLAFYFE
jgi:hypothetical protein